MATQKPLRILYQARNNRTGLTDVKAQVYLNGVAKAVGVGALTLSEVDATNSAGLYELLISGATLTAWGVAAGSYNCVEGYIDSVTASAKAAFREELTVANVDDVDAKLGAPAGASVSADIAAVKSELDTVNSNVSAVKSDVENVTTGLPAIKTAVNGVQSTVNTIQSDVEDATNGLAAIKNAINSVSSQVSSIQNNTNFEAFVPALLVKPLSGSTTYRIPIGVQKENGAAADPDANSIIVKLTNSGGVDRSSMLVGASGGQVAASRSGVGQYYADLTVASGATEEELIFEFDYAVNSAAFVKRRVGEVTNNVQADGFAQQSTLIAVQSTVGDNNTRILDIQSKVNDSTIGLANIESLVAASKADLENGTFGLAQLQALLANGTYGLAALQALLANGTYGLAAMQAMLASGSYGLAALQSLLNTANSGIGGVQSSVSAVQGTGFSSGQDDLHSIRGYLDTYLYFGGRSI